MQKSEMKRIEPEFDLLPDFARLPTNSEKDTGFTNGEYPREFYVRIKSIN